MNKAIRIAALVGAGELAIGAAAVAAVGAVHADSASDAFLADINVAGLFSAAPPPWLLTARSALGA